MGLLDSYGTVVGALVEGLQAKCGNSSFRTGYVHSKIDDVKTRSVEVQSDMGQEKNVRIPE